MADSNNKEISIVLEVKLSGIHESFDVTIEPGSYVSELVTETLEQCNVTDIKPEQCQLLLFSKTTVTPLEDEDLFNSINTALDERSKLILREAESNIHILKVYFHESDNCRIKYSFIVDETTTTDIINKSMATKLNLDEAQHGYRLINCVPAGNDYELHPNDIPLLMNTNYLEFRTYEKSPNSKFKQTPSKATNRHLKQLKSETKRKMFTLPLPPLEADSCDLLSPIATSTSLSPAHHATSTIDVSQSSVLPHLPSSSTIVTPGSSTALTNNTSSFVPISPQASKGRHIEKVSDHHENIAEMNTRHKRIVQSLESKLAEQYNRVHTVEMELNKAHSSVQAKNKQITHYKRELDNTIATKQQAIDTLSDLLHSEQEENEQLRKESLTLSGSLYQDLAIGRIGLAVKLVQPVTTHSENFSYEEVAAPISCNGSYILVNKVKLGFNILVVGDVILEVNGHSCRGASAEKAVQILEECWNEELHLVVARSQPEIKTNFSTRAAGLNSSSLEVSPTLPSPFFAPQFASTDSLDPPSSMPSSPAPTSASTDSLDPPPLPSSSAPQFPSTDSLDPPPLPLSPAPQFLSTDSLDPPPLPSSSALQFLSTDSLDPPPLPLSPAPQFSSTDSLDPPPLPSSSVHALASIDVANVSFDKISIKQHVKEITTLKKEIEQLQKIIEESEKRENEIFEEMELARKGNSEALGQTVHLESLLQKERHEKESYMKQFKEVERINLHMTQEWSRVQNQLQSDSVKLKQLEEVNESLSCRLVEVTEVFDTNKQKYEKQLEEMRRQLEEKDNNLSSIAVKEKVGHSAVKQIEENLITVQTELNKLKKTSKDKEEQLKLEIQDKKLENEKAMCDINEVKAANDKIKGELVSSQQELKILTVKYTTVNQKAQELEQNLEDLEKEKITLLKEFENYKTIQETNQQEHFDLKEKKLGTIKIEHTKIVQEKERELDTAKNNIASLEVKVQALEALQRERMTLLESDLHNSRKQSDRREDTIAEKDDRITQLHFSLKELTLEQQKDIQQRMKQLEDTQKELLVYKEKAHISEVDKKLQQEKLTSLDSDMQMLKKQSEKKDEAIASKDSQITELHSSLKEINTELRASQKQVFSEKERLVEFSEKAEKMKIKLTKAEVEQEKLKQQVSKAKQKNENIAKECDSIKKEKETTERKLTEVASTLNKEREDSGLEKKQFKQEIENLNTEIQNHKSLLEASQKESAQYKEKADELISTMEQELKSVKQQSEMKDESVMEKDVLIANLRSIVGKKSTEITTLQDQLKNQTEQVHTLSESLKTVSHTATTLQFTNEESIVKIKELETETIKLSNEIEQLHKEMSACKDTKNESESLNKRLLSQNKELQSKLEEMVQKAENQLKISNDETKKFQDRIDELVKCVNEFKDERSTLAHELSEQKDIMQTQRTNMEAEKQEMKMKFTSIEQQLSAANGELAIQRNSYASLESKTNTLYEQLSYFKSDKDKIDEKFINAVQEKERLKHELEVAKAELTKNVNESQKLQAEKEAELEDKVSELEYNKQTLERVKMNSKKLEEELNQVKKEAEDELRDTNSKHNQELNAMKEEMRSISEEVTTQQKSQSKLKKELQSSKQLVENLSEENAKLSKSLDEWREEYSNLEESSANDLERERNQYSANIEKLEKENKRKQEELLTQYSKAETKLQDDLQKQLKESESNRRTLMEEMEKHKAEVAKKIKEIESLNSYIEKLLPVVMEYKPSVLSVRQSSLSSIRY